MSLSPRSDSPLYIRSLILLVLFIVITHGKYTIFSTPIQVTFDECSVIKEVKIRFMTEASFYRNDFMMISFSQPLQDTPSALTFSLINDFSKQLSTGKFDFTIDTTIDGVMTGEYGMRMFRNGLDSSYISELSTATWFMSSREIRSQWLTLIIKIPRNIATTFNPRIASVNMAIVSSLHPQSIKYQYSNAMSYFYFASLSNTAPPQNIDARVANQDYGRSGQMSVNNNPSALNPIYMEFTPNKNFNNFQLNIEFTQFMLNQVQTCTTPTIDADFQFQGTCYFICQNTITCINAVSCTVKPNKIQVNIAELIMNQKYVLRFTVLNPPFKAKKYFMIWSDAVGSDFDTLNVPTFALQTNLITISIVEDDLKLFWKLPHSVVRDDMELGFFIDGGINTVEVGFKISSGSPFGEVLEVSINVGTSQLIMESIQHNLPSINTTISYDFSSPPYLVIRNVTALTRSNFRYWVAFRARHSTIDTNLQIDLTGQTAIKLAKYPNQHLFTPSIQVSEFPPFTRNTKDWTDYKDIRGFHADPANPTGATTLFRNLDTQVISSTDNGLQNGTSQAMRRYLNQPTTVGIDASIPNQQLLFLLKATDTIKIIGGATEALTDKYQTRIYYNPNIFQSVSNKGLEVVGYNRGINPPTDSKWQTQGNECYQDKSTDPRYQNYMCQKYDDHARQNRIDNFLDLESHSQIPFYRFYCGNDSGSFDNHRIMCIKTVAPFNCLQECTIFKGYNVGLTQWMAGVASIRNATFIPNYQSPVQAGDKNLDFVVAFYHNGIFVSASLINAYTVSFNNLQQTKVSLINTYHDNVRRNAGERVPTLIKIQGKLALSEYINLQYPDKIKLYLPSTAINLENFIVNNNELGCSYHCRLNKSFTTAISQNWLQMTSVVVENMPTMTNDFKILLPIQLKGNLMSVYVGFQARGRLVAVYRIGGSAVRSTISGSLTNIFNIQTSRVAPLWDLTSDWTTAPFSVADYKQRINLQRTNTLNSSVVVSMAQSVLPNRVKPFVTVTIRQLQIIADYTSIIVGNNNRNRSCDKFNYWFKVGLVSKKIQTFVCEMYTNENTTNNDITINFPIFSNMLGPAFPYDQVFTYAYASDVDGSLEAIRRQTSDKVHINLCRTNKATQYNINERGRQLQIFRIQIEPLLLSQQTYSKIRIVLTLPNNIEPVQCNAIENIFSQKLKCSVILPFFTPTTILQLELLDTKPIKLLDFFIYLNCKQDINMVTIVPNQKYQVKIQLPHNTANQQVIYGQSFNTFKSTAYACENTFTHINAAYNETILITNYNLNSISLNLNTELQFILVFSKQKQTLPENSCIHFSFVGLEVNQETYCYLAEFPHVFWTRQQPLSFPGDPNTYYLRNNADVPSLTDNPVTVKCSNLLLTDFNPNPPTLKVTVWDLTVGVQIMTSLANGASPKVLSTTPYFSQNSVVSNTGTILGKDYRTMGFNGEYTITYNIAVNGLVQGFIDLSEYSFDQRLVGCKLNIAQEVFCKVHQLNTDSKLQYRTNFIYFKTYYVTSSPSIVLTIYPLLQEKQVVPPIIRTIIKIGSSLHYIEITDTLPLLPVTDVFFIDDYNIVPVTNLTSVMFDLEITYQFATAVVNQPLFIQLNQILFYSSIAGVTLKCTIDGADIPCVAIQKDLVRVNAFAYTANTQYLLRIKSFGPNYQIYLRDKENFFIRAFIIDPSTKQIDFVSYLNTDLRLATRLMTLIKSYQASVNKPSLIWNLTDSRGITFLPKVYIGYFGPSIELMVYDSSKFVNQFIVYSAAYNSSGFKCEMGYSRCHLPLIADNFNSVIRKYQFLHTNAYYMQPPLLEVEISNQQCRIVPQFTNYKIFQNGLTLPIILNFTHCRPRQLIRIEAELIESEVKLDDSLSELEVTAQNPIAILFVRHSSPVLNLVNYTLELGLAGTYASSFILGQTTIIIQKIARTESSIQAKLPQMLNLSQNQTSLRVQCNEPSTVYWAIGFDPTTRGEKGQDIQTRLLNGQKGLRTSISDPLTYGNREYGLTFTNIPNVWKTLNIRNLQGNSVYTFKYFCVNIMGSFSDGQMITFTTPRSTYQMVKLTLGFPSPLTFMKVNDFACAISESLTIPYEDVRSSVNTNCKTASLIFYGSHHDSIRDFNTQGQKPYFYNNFYIRPTTQPSQVIVSTIRDKLRNSSRILRKQLPLWEVFNIQQIQPDVITPSFEGELVIEVFQQQISMTFPIRNQQFYIIIGLLSSYFNQTTMSLPETYLIKSGKFSQSVNFDKVFMNYTTSETTFKFQGLTSATNYSIFYFITVDNPAINAKHSEVKFMNLMTKNFITIDLWGENLVATVYVWFGLFSVLVYLF